MVKNILKNWDYGQVDLTTAGTVYEVCRVRGGESVTIKALTANAGNAYVGSDKLVSAATGFELDATETVTLTLPISFGKDNEIVIYGVTDNSGDDLCFVKLIDLFAETAAAG